MKLRVVPTKVHGTIDYLTAPALAVAPDVLHLNGMRSSALVPRAFGAGEAVMSALTDYELGARKVIPLRAHLAADAIAGAALAAAPWLFGSARQGPRHWLPHALVGAADIALAATTRTRAPRRRRAVEAVRQGAGDALRSRTVLVAGGAALLVGTAVAVGWRRRYKVLALFADAVEEVSDTIEDAAEDLGDAARERQAATEPATS
jgi:hypothetical protein